MDVAKLTISQKKALSVFTAEADRFETAVARLTKRELDYSAANGDWTIRQIVHHLVDGNNLWLFFLNRAIATPGTTMRLEGFPGNEAWAEGLAFHKRPIQAVLALITAQHRFLAEAAAYFADAWDQYVVFIDAEGKEAQRMSAGQIINMLSEHLAEHVATIETIKKQCKAQRELDERLYL